MQSLRAHRRLRRLVCSLITAAAIGTGLSAHAAETIELPASYADDRVYITDSQVQTSGKILTTASAEKTNSLPLEATARFQFRERRLPPRGRDAQALRAVREFESASMQANVGGRETVVALDPSQRLIVANGDREGIINYSLRGPLTRETLDLLEIPGDSLGLVGVLPLEPVTVGETWNPADWVIQMLTGIEAVESSELTCTLGAADAATATITFEGKIVGQRQGASTTIEVAGRTTYNRQQQFLQSAQLEYKVDAGIGTVSPGLEATVNANLQRSLSPSTGSLTSSLAASIPLEAPPEALMLQFTAEPWGLRIRHDRAWHIFQALFEGQTQVAILRMMELGSLICQCNFSPIARAAAGEHIPLEQFENDIQTSLGSRFKRIVSRERIPTDDGRVIFRVLVDGAVELKGTEATASIPMTWIYYLCANSEGRQVSFVFAIEPNLVESLRQRDIDLVKSVEFFPPRR